MDIEFARTFVTVVETGSFLAAADRLNVTQSTVSARIKELEIQLGRPLLDRGRHGAKPTAAGHQFNRHAGALVRIWQQARHELSLPEDMTQVLTIGAQVSLWDRLLGDWIGEIRINHPRMAVRAELATAPVLMRQVIDGLLDIAVVYTPQSGPGLVVRQIFNERLVFVSDRADHPPEPGSDYVLCDWGPEFQAEHALAYPDASAPVLTVNAGTIGLAHVLAHGGSVYIPKRIAAPHLQAGRLFEVADTPGFDHPAFVVHAKRDPDDPVHEAVTTIADIARRIGHDSG